MCLRSIPTIIVVTALSGFVASCQEIYYVSNVIDWENDTFSATLWSLDIESLNHKKFGELSFDHNDISFNRYVQSLAVHPNGSLYASSRTRIYRVDITGLQCNTVAQIFGPQGLGNSLAFDDRGKGYAGSRRYYYFESNGNLVYIKTFSTTFVDFIFDKSLLGLLGFTEDMREYRSLVEIDEADELHRIIIDGRNLDGVSLSSITKVVQDCETRFLAASVDSKLYWLDTIQKTVEYITDLNGQYIQGLASTSEVLNRLVLDLDTDDSSGRIGVAFANRGSCQSRLAIADEDVQLSFCNEVIDSIWIRIPEGALAGQLILPASMPGGVMKISESRESLFFTVSGANLEDIAIWISQMAFQLDQPGSAEIEIQFEIFAGEESARAGSYLYFEDLSEDRNLTVSYCPGERIDLAGLLPSGASGGIWVRDTREGQGIFDASLDPQDTYLYVKNTGACQDRYSFFVVPATGNQDYFPEDTSMCRGEMMTLYRENFFSEIIWPDRSTGNSFDIVGPGAYLIEYRLAGCTFSEVITVQVSEEFTLHDTVYNCDETSIVDLSAYNDEYRFTWPDGYTGSHKAITGFGEIRIGLESRTTHCGNTLVLSVLEDPDCPECHIYFPNAITPNGDGINDVWFAQGTCLQEQELRIYNRWGRKVYQAKGDAIRWEPSEQQSGVYVFQFKYKDGNTGKSEIRQGNITVIH